MNALEQTRTAAAIAKDWLGEGGEPVAQPLAEARATICEFCPENLRDDSWWGMIKHSAAIAFRECLEYRLGRSISVSNEDKLQFCCACGCHTKLKVHVPIQHIRDHTPDAHRQRLPHSCWIIAEINGAKIL